MKKVTCHQMKVISDEQLKLVHGAGSDPQSRSESMLIAFNGNGGCVAGARNAQRKGGKN